MATSSIRFVIIVALVIVGAVLIARFPEASTPLASGGTPTPTSTPTDTGGTTPGGGTGDGTGGGQQAPVAQVKGVKVAVYNGTFQTGLAADAAADLVDQFDYKINPQTSILDAEDKPFGDQTTIYYVAGDDKIEAEALADSYFKKLDVKIAKLPAGFSVPDGVRLAVYLGNDYATTR